MSGSDYVVIPTVITNDYEYLTWYVKVTADGGATMWTTPKSLYVGCTSSVSIIQFTDDSIAFVGDTNMAVYQYMLPIVTRSYCRIINAVPTNVYFDGVSSSTALDHNISIVVPFRIHDSLVENDGLHMLLAETLTEIVEPNLLISITLGYVGVQ